MIALIRELQQGYRPDLVLFYDGVNDTTSALLEGQPTVTTNEVNRVREFNLSQSPARLASALAGNLIQNSALFRFAGSVARRSGLGPVKEPKALSESGMIGLAMGVVRGYVANVELVEALGKTYGFRPVFVWQPDIFSKPKLVPFEAEEKAKYGWASSLFTEVHRQLERIDALVSDPDFLNLSGIFSEADSLQFLDFCHTTEEANARIASVLVSKLLETAKVGPGARPQALTSGRIPTYNHQATGRGCSLSTTSVNRRGPPSMPRAKRVTALPTRQGSTCYEKLRSDVPITGPAAEQPWIPVNFMRGSMPRSEA